MDKVSKLHISLIGGGAALVLALILYFAMIRPSNEKIRIAQGAISTAEAAGGTETKIQQNKKAYKDDVDNSNLVHDKWRISDMRYMPEIPLNDPDLLRSYEFSIKDLPTRYGKWITAWYDLQIRMGIRRQSGTDFALPALVKIPNDIATLDHITLPDQAGKPWNVAVEATSFDAGLAHIRKFLTMTGHGVPVVDNVALTGHSPHLSMTYTLALYIIPRVKPTPADPVISPAPTAGGAMGGPMGGSMGGPMGGGRMGASGRPAMSMPPRGK